ncbi:MAG TPA: hypothetical protein PKD90_02455, partial [Phnomibacter sp.]|nr:hypothetical protein [Phnomibacter sp.]
DCKALTNFMYSMLKEAGIPSIYTLVKSGRGLVRFQEKFPSQQFDHVILCVPNGTDSIWLECTSQSNPTGYLGSFTANRPVLLVMEKGSKLVRTPHYSLEQNYQNSTLQGRITPDGHLTGTIITNYGAMQSERVHGLIHHARPDEQKEYLAEAFDLGTYVINDYKYEERLKKYIPEVEERVQFDASHFAQVTGRRLLFTPNVLNKSTQRLTKDTARKYDVLFTYGYVDRDTVIIEVGENYAPEAMPKVATIESRFGRYKSEASFNNGKLVYVREMQRFEGRYPPEAYNELVAFLDAVNKADRARVVLVKPEG